MKCFRSRDREDLQALCDAGLLKLEPLRQSLESAFLWTTAKDGDDARDRAFANLAKVEVYLKGAVLDL